MSNSTVNAPALSSLELKFLLGLLALPGYRGPLAQVRLSAKTSRSERHRLCQQLCQQGLVDYEDMAAQFGLTAAGRTLLTLDTSVLPITPDERLVLQSCQAGSIGPARLHPKVPKTQQQRLVAGLAQRGLLTITRYHITDVWLTPGGQQFLRYDCAPQGHVPVVSWTQLSGYLHFMRQGSGAPDVPEPSESVGLTSLTPDELLQIITHLDAVLNTDNYLPIYYLRDKLHSALSRPALDQQLYQLQRDDRIDLSTLQDVTHYRQEEIAAGIPQDIGGPLFFISVV